MLALMRPALFLALLTFAACADPLERAEVADLRKRLDEAQRRQATHDQKIEALEDRLFLLTDQVESQKVASGRTPAPRLPVVTLRPSEDAPPPPAEDEVEYRGEARSATPDKTRPFLHAEAPPPPKHRRAPSGPSSPIIPASDENLGVAPAPDVARITRELPSLSPAPSVANDPMRLYKAAYEDLRGGRHDLAAQQFRDLIRKFPRHDLADNAQYWLGECFYDRKRYAEAAGEFRAAVAQYPLGNKAPDALLKLGYCLLAIGDRQKGRDALRQVPEAYPRTEAARLASERLAELGHMEGTQ
jgi:tol-pal system protein YbgF